ncbi:MAG: methyltransferase domain-containing protein [Candidatus Moranbacteria bacterium]|nr:methyltransferase domain-containing protein [Candidatus Moranbacteria bacterium]
MRSETAKKILIELEQGYDLIADKFSGTRAFMWRDLEFMKHEVNPDDKVLDFGCGNGRLAGFLENNYQEFTGVDISQKLIDIAKQRYHSEKTEFIKVSPISKRSDCATKKECGQASFALPFKDDYFDVVFSIAVFHHFPSKKYALKIAKELHRVLKPGGKIVITVWNLWQKQYLKFHQKTSKSWIDANISFKSGKKIFNRYHHPFEMGELENIFQEAGFETLKTKEGWNLLYIGRKSVVDK